MNRRRAVFIFTLLFTLDICGSAQTIWKSVSSFQYDWNSHSNVQFVLEIPSAWNDPGDFTRIRIRVPGQKEFALTSNNGWVKYGSDDASLPPEMRKTKNLVASEHVLAVKVAENRTLLFLLGYSYASSPGSLDVLEISDAGQPRVVLHLDEFELREIRDLDGDGVPEVVGHPCLSEEFGNGLLTYDPFNIYRLGETATPANLSLPLSKSYNLKHYYGWAGVQCRDDVAVVIHSKMGGKPTLIKIDQAEHLGKVDAAVEKTGSDTEPVSRLSHEGYISIMVTVLGVTIAVAGLGAAVLAFFGWRSLSDEVIRRAEEAAKRVSIEKVIGRAEAAARTTAESVATKVAQDFVEQNKDKWLRDLALSVELTNAQSVLPSDASNDEGDEKGNEAISASYPGEEENHVSDSTGANGGSSNPEPPEDHPR